MSDCATYPIDNCLPPSTSIPETTTTVTAPSTTTPSRDDGLPVTGGDVISLVVIAIALIVTGLVLYLRNRP